MKKIIINTLTISILLLIIIGCEKKEEEVMGFKKTYLDNFSKDEVFFIKGIALDVYEYGRNIKVIGDLKGNFIEESSIFVWGDGVPYDTAFIGLAIDPPRFDCITKYHNNDTLIMFLKKAHKRFDRDIENDGDYTTILAAHSILKLTDGYVSGCISSMWYEENTEETILWEDLRKELQKRLSELEEKKGDK